MAQILIFLSLGLIAISLVLMVVFGLRALIAGRKNYIAIGSIVLALVVFLIAFAIANPDAYQPLPDNPVHKAEAAIVLTAVVMFCLAILGLVVSAARGLIR